VKDCAKFQVIAIRGFRFIMITFTHTPTYTHSYTQADIYHDKLVAISALPYNVAAQMSRNTFRPQTSTKAIDRAQLLQLPPSSSGNKKLS